VSRNTLAYWVHSQVTKKIKCCECDPRSCIHKTSFYSYLKNGPTKLLLHYLRLERHARDKHPSLLAPFIRMKCCEYSPVVLFILFVVLICSMLVIVCFILFSICCSVLPTWFDLLRFKTGFSFVQVSSFCVFVFPY